MQYSIAQFCENVRRLRIHSNLSVGEMAEILELSEDNQLLLESGVLTDEMDIRILDHIYRHFRVTPNQMFEELTL